MKQFQAIVCIIVLYLTASHGFGQSLFEEGRKAYVETGNKAQLKRIIDAFDGDDISQGYVPYHKLCGDYHYLNTDDDYRSYDSADRHFKLALNYIEDASNETVQDVHYYQFILHQELAQLYYKQGNYSKAYEEMKKAEVYSTQYLDDDNKILDFISQLALCKARVAMFDEALEDINMVLSHYPDKKSKDYGEALRKKAKILMLKQEDSGMADPADDAMRCYQAYFNMTKEDLLKHLGDMGPEDREHYWMHIRPFVVDCYRTESTDPAFLYDVALFSKSLLLEYAQKGKLQPVTWRQIQKQLKSTDCALEFVQYEKYGEKQMGALVLKKTGKPHFVRIGALADIENLSLYLGDHLLDAVVYDDAALKDDLYGDSAIFNQIWTPELLKAIGKETHRLYFSADGLFHELAIEYMLPDAPEQTSLKSENLYRLSSTRQLLVSSSKTRGGDLLLCGGIDFYGNPQNKTGNEETSYSNDKQAYQILKSRKIRFGLLNGTFNEIEGIRQNYDESKVTLLTDTLATEAHVAFLIGKHSIVHLATHGFYFGVTPEGSDLLPASYDEALSQSGLAFAGSSSALMANDFNATQHDGIFSAREIAKMDYSHVDVVVLSACQTALGYMTGDGIFGLQRSLKNAGVKAMILSLWSVDDDATSTLMQAFYKHLPTEDTHDAFMHAREELVKSNRKPISRFNPELLKNETTGDDFASPYFYNAFILIDIK